MTDFAILVTQGFAAFITGALFLGGVVAVCCLVVCPIVSICGANRMIK